MSDNIKRVNACCKSLKSSFDGLRGHLHGSHRVRSWNRASGAIASVKPFSFRGALEPGRPVLIIYTVRRRVPPTELPFKYLVLDADDDVAAAERLLDRMIQKAARHPTQSPAPSVRALIQVSQRWWRWGAQAPLNRDQKCRRIDRLF